MGESNYLKLARQAQADGNTEDAKLYYGKVREENPESGEAKFFYAYYSLYEGKNGEIPTRFYNLCSALTSAIKMVKDSSEPKEDQLRVIESIVNAFVPETWAENRYMNHKNHETKVGDSYVTVFSYSDIKSVCTNGMKTLKSLGDLIENLYVSNPKCKELAVVAWKEYVSLSQKWYSYAIKGDAEIYAEKIKKVDPTYEMPKKAGCISFGDKKK